MEDTLTWDSMGPNWMTEEAKKARKRMSKAVSALLLFLKSVHRWSSIMMMATTKMSRNITDHSYELHGSPSGFTPDSSDVTSSVSTATSRAASWTCGEWRKFH